MGKERVSTNLSRYHRYDQDDSGVERSAQGGAMPFRRRQRCGQPSENRHIPDRIDRGPDRCEIFANLDEERRHFPGGVNQTASSLTSVIVHTCLALLCYIPFH